LRWWDRQYGEKPLIHTLYVGGGTPTCLSVLQWQRLIESLVTHLERCLDTEISIEANPESLSVEHMALWKDWGVTRVSLGIQSLWDDELLWLKRHHTATRALWAVDQLLKYGFNVSGDLMFGLAGQSLKKWHHSLSGLVHSGVSHLSIYQLSIEEGSVWGKMPPSGLQNGYGHYRWSQWYLEEKGFSQYEIASFAKPGCECRHNQAYWFQKNVLPLGPSAWDYNDGVRFWNVRTLAEYVDRISQDKSAVEGKECLDLEKRGREFAVLALRTSQGIDISLFTQRFGDKLFNSILSDLQNVPEDCLLMNGTSLALSRKGMRVANAIWSLII
jgi:oxygen-independent coproporphyrinogen-3 oxidase